MSDERRSRLLATKLRALVAEHLGNGGLDQSSATSFPSGAALVHDGAAWVLVEGSAERSLGAALAWAVRHDARGLELIAERDTGLLARRASRFRLPSSVWFAEERSLLPAVAEPLAPPPRPRSSHVALTPLIESSGAVANVEHGVVTGEVCGLEVCRVVDEPTLGRLTDEHGMPLATGAGPVAADGEGGVILEVGVGANDREAFQLIHGHLPKTDALADVVRAVAAHRAPDAPAHPLNRMAPERALRAAALADPTSIGMATLTALEPPVPRPSMKEVAPCVAAGHTADGDARTVVFSTGVDLELAPFVADVNAMLEAASPGSTAPPVVAVMPRRDLLPITQQLLDLLDHPVAVVHPGDA